MKKCPLIGKTILSVYLAKDKRSIQFLCGNTIVFANVGADCCSETWIESIDMPELLLGTVYKVEDIDMPIIEGFQGPQECTEFYGCKITTSKGVVVIDYRNSSNGYYGGWLTWNHQDFQYTKLA